MTERDKQAYIWNALNDELKDDAQAVSLALACGTDELWSVFTYFSLLLKPCRKRRTLWRMDYL